MPTPHLTLDARARATLEISNPAQDSRLSAPEGLPVTLFQEPGDTAE